MNRNVIKSLVLSFVFAVVTVSVLNAQTVVNVEKFTAEKSSTPEIRYAGSNNDFISFDVSVRLNGNQKQVLRIIDESGVELYRENISKADFAKTVRVFRNDYSRLNFVVDSPTSQYKKTFTISSELVERLNVQEAAN